MNSYESAQSILHILDVVIRLGAVVGIAFWARKMVLSVRTYKKTPNKIKPTNKIPQKREFVKGAIR